MKKLFFKREAERLHCSLHPSPDWGGAERTAVVKINQRTRAEGGGKGDLLLIYGQKQLTVLVPVHKHEPRNSYLNK